MFGAKIQVKGHLAETKCCCSTDVPVGDNQCGFMYPLSITVSSETQSHMGSASLSQLSKAQRTFQTDTHSNFFDVTLVFFNIWQCWLI